MTILITSNGRPVRQKILNVEKITTDQPTPVEGSGLKKKKTNPFTNFKISTNTEPAKQKASKFINLKL